MIKAQHREKAHKIIFASKLIWRVLRCVQSPTASQARAYVILMTYKAAR